MTIVITLEQILHLAPNAQPDYRTAMLKGQAVFTQSGITASGLRVAHFMAQILHESAALTIQSENLSYSAARLAQVWPRRFKPKGPLDPQDYAHSPQKLANEVYGGRMGNNAPDDGYTYRGRGLLQLTGKDSYRQATQMLRQEFPDAPDFVASPDLVCSAQWALQVAAAIWLAKGCNKLADQDDLNGVTQAINGGLIGLTERAAWLAKTKGVWLS